MRYKYRVRVFYSITFFILGLIAGYFILGYSPYSINSLNNMQDNNMQEKEQQAGMDELEGTISEKSLNIGIMLPESEAMLKNAISMAVMDLDSNESKLDIIYETSKCSENDIKSTITKLKDKDVEFIYGIFCNETIKTAVTFANTNNIHLITPSTSREMAKSLGQGVITVDQYQNITKNTARFMIAYKALYKTEPDTFDAVSYDAINMIYQLRKDNQIRDYEGVLGMVNVDEQGYSYFIILK